MQIGERLKAARISSGFETAREAADSLGIPYGTYSLHETGERGIARKVEHYARRFHVSADWLLRGVGKGPSERSGIPLVAWISAGALSSDEARHDPLGYIDIGALPDGDWIALRVRGDSMDRISPPDSIILVDRSDRRLIPNGCYVIADIDGGATYKRFRPDPMRFEPVSTNKDLEAIFPDHEPIIVGRVRRTILDM